MAIKVFSARTMDIDGLFKELDQGQLKVVLYFFSPEFEQSDIQQKIKRVFPRTPCVGASMYGGWSTAGAVEKGIVAMSLSADEVEEVFVVFKEGVKTQPALTARSAIEDLKRKLGYRTINPDEYLGVILVDGLCMGEEIMKAFTLSKELNMPFVGGGAAEYLTFTKPTFVSVDEKRSSDGLAVIVMKMKIPFFYNHYVHLSATNASFVITKADPAKRILWEINGEPAAPYYAKLVGVSGVDKLNMNIFGKNPLGIVIGETTYVRGLVGVIEGTGLQSFCYIEAGTKVFIVKPGDIIDNARKALRDAESYIPNVCGAILFNCAVRYLELQELRKVDAFNSVFSHLNFIGFNAYGEELFTYHNQTLTAIFFGRN